MNRKKNTNSFFEYGPKVPLLIVVLSVYVLHLFFHTLLIPLKVRSASMQPNINQNSYLFYSSIGMPNSLLPFSQKIPRGTIVVLSPPYHKALSGGRKWLNTLYRFITLNIGDLNRVEGQGQNPYMVRRIIGIPGDTVYMAGNIAQIQTESRKSREQQGTAEGQREYFTSEFELITKDYTIISDSQKNRNWPKNLPLQGNTQKVTLREGEYFALADNRNIGNDSSYWGPLRLEQIRGRVLFAYIKRK